jgi:transposase
MAESNVRFVALDIHKTYAMVGALDAQQMVVLPPRRVPLTQLAEWTQRHLRPTDQVVLEATTNTWAIYDQLTPLVARVVVAHPAHVQLIAASFVKTDTRDTLSLARLLAANLIPGVWVPPTQVRELRSLIAHRQRLVQQRTAAKNRLHGIVQRHNLLLPEGDLWSHKHQGWWESQPLAAVERLRARQDLATIAQLSTQIAEVEAELAHLSMQAPWAEQVPFLIQLPGIALVSAMTVLSAIGDITRFASAKHLVGYSGLGARVHASGKTNRSGGITKQGRRELRAVLIEAAHAAIQSSPLWRRRLSGWPHVSAHPRRPWRLPASCW